MKSARLQGRLRWFLVLLALEACALLIEEPVMRAWSRGVECYRIAAVFEREEDFWAAEWRSALASRNGAPPSRDSPRLRDHLAFCRGHFFWAERGKDVYRRAAWRPWQGFPVEPRPLPEHPLE